MTFQSKAGFGGRVRVVISPLASALRLRLLVGALAVAFFGSAFAQTAAAPASPGASGAASKPLAKGSGTSSGPILTRDELRACFAQDGSLVKRIDASAADRSAHNKEKEDIAAAQQTTRAERAKVDTAQKQAEDYGVRAKAYSERVASWNQRVTEHNEGKGSASQAERTRLELNKEREDLAKAATELEAEKTRIISATTEAVNAFNAKAGALDQRITAWNERNAKLNEAAAALEKERLAWVQDCSDRRYREEDETAIRAGK